LKKLPFVAGLALLAACSDATTSPVRIASESIKPSATLSPGNNTVVVREADIARQAENSAPTQAWVFYVRNAGSGAFVAGPGSPPLGTGSFQISTAGSSDKGFLFNFDHTGVAISSIDAISYSTYISTPGSSDARQAPSINIQIDKNGGTFETGDFATLVFEPVYNTTQGIVTVGSWQTWDAISGGTASWWATGGSSLCPPAGTFCTWADVLSRYPGATIVGGFGINQGSGNGSLVASTDALTLGYGGNSITYDFEDSNCHWSDAGTTRTLLGDCVTSTTIGIPNGMTFNGAGYTITAIDPAGGHFVGAVIRNLGTSANVTNLHVTASNLTNTCDAGADRLRGILFEGASGSITNNTVTGVRQGLSGCQEGNAIEVRNTPLSESGSVEVGPDVTVTISGNTVSNYQKNGITANGAVVANIFNNTVTGDGPINYIAQNGIQVGFGGTATLKGNVVSGNWYSPADTESCGVLLYRADGVKSSSNNVFNNEKNQCNYGKGGGNVKATN
jgi:hypothetical protein